MSHTSPDPGDRLPGGEHGDAPIASTTPGTPGAAPGAPPPPTGIGAPTPPGTPPGTPAGAQPSIHRERRSRHMGWRSRDVLRTAALVITFYLVLRLLWFAQQLVIVTFLGVLIGLAVTAAVDRLERWRIPRGLGAALVVFGSVGLLALFGAWMAPTLRTQSRELRTKLPEAFDKIESWAERREDGLLGLLMGGSPLSGSSGSGGAAAGAQPAAGQGGSPAGQQADSDAPPPDEGRAGGPVGTVESAGAHAPRPAQRVVGQVADAVASRAAPGDDAAAAGGAQDTAAAGAASDSAAQAQGGLRSRVLEGVGSARRYLFSFITSTFAVLGGLLLVLFIAIYVATEPQLYHRGMMHLFPRPARQRAGEVLSAIATTLRRWLLAQLVAMLIIGVVTTGVLMALDVRAAIPLGILAGLLEFIPMIGPLMSAIPAVAMGFVDSPQKALWVAVAYTAIQFAENQLLIPILMKEGVDLPPALTIIAIALMGLVFGFLGMLVAVPLLAAAVVVVKMLYVEDVVGETVTILGDDDDE